MSKTTIADFFEPTREDIGYAKQLRESGPGVAHVAWGVEGIDQVYEDLVKKGNNMGGFGQGKPGSSPFHYKVASVDPGSSKGVSSSLKERPTTPASPGSLKGAARPEEAQAGPG